MIAANVIDKSELPEFDEELGLLPRQEDSGGLLQAIIYYPRSWAQDYERFFSPVSMLNSQSMLRNYATSYALAR